MRALQVIERLAEASAREKYCFFGKVRAYSRASAVHLDEKPR